LRTHGKADFDKAVLFLMHIFSIKLCEFKFVFSLNKYMQFLNDVHYELTISYSRRVLLEN